MPWGEQKECVLRAIAEQSAKTRVILIVSEVCWATGFRVPVEDLAHDLEALANPPLLIIDGAHAVGNSLPPHPIAVGEAYIFSAHKWLLSPEPGGILLGRGARPVYDAWVDQVPEVSAGFAGVCGLHSALATTKSMLEEKRRTRSSSLKDLLVQSIQPFCSVVGARTGLVTTSLFSIRPADGYHWLQPQNLTNALARKEVNALVIYDGLLTGGEAWIRISLPFFSDWGEVLRLGEILVELVDKG